MGSISLLTVVVLAIAVNYANSMRGTRTPRMRTDPRRPILRRILTFDSTMPGTPPSSDLNENIRRVLLVIDRNMNPSQQSSVDPCRQYQLVKERQLEANPPQTSRNTRRSRSNNPDPLTPNAEAAMSGCSTAVNAFLALPPAYRTACPKVQNAACKNIDSYLTCAVLIPTYALGCIYTGLTYLSLKRCADHAIQERDRAIREQREAEMIRVHQRQLSERARAVAAANAAAYPPAPVASAPAGPRTSGQGGGRRASPPSTPAGPPYFFGRNSQDFSGPSRLPGADRSSSG
ncbi:uncharacterized protein [Bemisia tabaci]|uniref:uncharacterized protein n=1 Tax=Bemisia tabaci TaxID=7038 RepID=UPI003B283B5E